MPPREFDELRDEAFLQSLLLDPFRRDPLTAARQAVEAALALTLPGDPAWQRERERLALLDADLVFAGPARPPRWPGWTRRRNRRRGCPTTGGPCTSTAWAGRRRRKPRGREAARLPPDDVAARFQSGLGRPAPRGRGRGRPRLRGGAGRGAGAFRRPAVPGRVLPPPGPPRRGPGRPDRLRRPAAAATPGRTYSAARPGCNRAPRPPRGGTSRPAWTPARRSPPASRCSPGWAGSTSGAAPWSRPWRRWRRRPTSSRTSPRGG